MDVVRPPCPDPEDRVEAPKMRLLTPLGVPKLDNPRFSWCPKRPRAIPSRPCARLKRQKRILMMRSEDALRKPGQPSPALAWIASLRLHNGPVMS